MEKGKLSVALSNERTGEPTTIFRANTRAIYARWQGRGLRPQAKIRAVWIAQDVADVAADYQIDEASTVAPSPNSRGIFTISQPEGGWLPGSYRVEFYVDESPDQIVKLTITK
jgi:hypothetical protein